MQKLKRLKKYFSLDSHLPAEAPEGTNIHNTIGLSVITIYSGFKLCRNSLVQFTGTFDCQGTFHYEFIPEGKIVNKEMYHWHPSSP